MSTLSRKLFKKLHPKNKKTEKPPEKVGKDYLLIIILSLTIIFLAIGWANFDNVNRALYVALIVSLGTTYVRRHLKITESQDELIERVGLIAMAAAIVLFVAEIYIKFIA